jgi:hypothetical protein
MSCFKYICCGVFTVCNMQLVQAQETIPAIRKTNFTVIGNISSSANFYTSNESIYTRPSYSWNLNGNLLGKIGNISIPLNFVVNQYDKSNAPAFAQVGLSPNYKWATLHLGYRYMSFSPLIFEGQSFKGVGLELNPKLFRFAAFHGKLNRAINEDTSRNNYRVPQFSRTAYGIKVGYGNSSRFIDLVYFHAKDDSSSTTVLRNKVFYRPQENAVVGTSFRLTMMSKLILTGDLAVSGLVQDLGSLNKSLDSSRNGLKKFIKNFLPTNETTTASYGGQSSLVYFSRSFSSNFGYRRVAPNFKSMGTPYMLNDIELVSWANNFSLAKGKVSFSSNLSQQHNNLDKNLQSELKTQVGNFNVNTILGQHLNLNVNYSGYNLKQKEGRSSIPDSFRLSEAVLLNQKISQVNISPGYNITKNDLIHYISGNINLSYLRDKNAATARFSNSDNFSSSINYTLSFIKKSVSIYLNSLYTRYKQDVNTYTSYGPTFGTSAQLLKNKNLNVQGNIGCFFNRYNSNKRLRNMSYSLNSGYQAKHHSFGVYANYIYTQPNNAIIDAINKTYPYAVATKNLAGGVSYNYTF